MLTAFWDVMTFRLVGRNVMSAAFGLKSQPSNQAARQQGQEYIHSLLSLFDLHVHMQITPIFGSLFFY
jgi:hypothetical protein